MLAHNECLGWEIEWSLTTYKALNNIFNNKKDKWNELVDYIYSTYPNIETFYADSVLIKYECAFKSTTEAMAFEQELEKSVFAWLSANIKEGN